MYYNKYASYKNEYIKLKKIKTLCVMIKNQISMTIPNINLFLSQSTINKKILLVNAKKYKHEELINLLSNSV